VGADDDRLVALTGYARDEAALWPRVLEGGDGYILRAGVVNGLVDQTLEPLRRLAAVVGAEISIGEGRELFEILPNVVCRETFEDGFHDLGMSDG